MQRIRVTSIALCLCVVMGCSRYHTPKRVVYLPDYGYLPADVHKDYTNVYPTLAAREFLPPDSIDATGADGGSRWVTRTVSLPRSEAEARSRVKRNVAQLNEGAEAEAAERTPLDVGIEVVLAPIAMVALIAVLPAVFVLHAIGESLDDSYDEAVRAWRERYRARLAETGVQVTIRVQDTRGEPLQDVFVLPIVSPTTFMTFADDEGERLYPYESSYEFYVSDRLADLLARDMLDARDYLEAFLDSTLVHRTGHDGAWQHVNGVLAAAERPTPQDGYVMHYLVAKPGYRGAALRTRITDASARDVELSATLQSRDADDRSRHNAWHAANSLAAVVDYFDHEKYPHDYTAGHDYDATTMPMSVDDFRDILALAETEVPEYPLVRKARFYYEFEFGNRDRAARHGRFIADGNYVRAYYGVTWSTGLPLDH